MKPKLIVRYRDLGDRLQACGFDPEKDKVHTDGVWEFNFPEYTLFVLPYQVERLEVFPVSAPTKAERLEEYAGLIGMTEEELISFCREELDAYVDRTKRFMKTIYVNGDDDCDAFDRLLERAKKNEAGADDPIKSLDWDVDWEADKVIHDPS